ncbi:MAG: dihydroorotase [Flavobacteriales bacterium]|nr:dihydroorotase [Flavobacteriales bacterium]
MFDLIIKNGILVNHNGIGNGDIAISGGKIAAIGDLKTQSANKIIDAKGLHILPGLIDTQVHFREPGLEHKEDLETGANAAVLGGICSVFEMPNTNPTTSSISCLGDKINRANGRMSCDFAFYAGATNDNIDFLPDLEREIGCAGIKVFMGSSTGNLLVKDDENVGRILQKITRRAAFHSEDEFILEEEKKFVRAGDPSSHYEARSSRAALSCTMRLVKLAREFKKRIHILHVSTKEEMEFLKAHKDLVSIEVLPNHLAFYGPDIYNKIGTLAQQNPPIREKHHNDALWAAVQNGLVDVMGSDHAPHTLEEKSEKYLKAPSGGPLVQHAVVAMFEAYHQGKISIEKIVEKMCHNPAKIFKIEKRGFIKEGFYADLAIVDVAKPWSVKKENILYKCGWSPLEGTNFKSRVVYTLVNGQIVNQNGQIKEIKAGKRLLFDRE